MSRKRRIIVDAAVAALLLAILFRPGHGHLRENSHRLQRGYSVYVPGLPGCITTAPSIEEASCLIQEAIDFHLEGLGEDGLEIPQPTAVAGYVEASAA
jgi:predicted RNase H-like HicB family nuclease